MSLPPVPARPLPPADPAAVRARPGQEDASTGSGKPFDILLAERGGPPQTPLPAQDGDARQEQDKVARTVAEMFNEHGFFANAAELHPQTPGDHAAQRNGSVSVEAASAQPASAPVRIGPQASSAGEATNALPGSAASPEGPPGAGTPPYSAGRPDGFAGSLAAPSGARFAGWTIGSPTAPRASTPHAPQTLATATRTPAADAKRSVVSQDDAAASRSDKRLAARIEEHLRRTSANAVRVDVRSGDDGLLVMARADALDRAERSRLLTEIEALLSRHGHASARINLNGEPAPLRRV